MVQGELCVCGKAFVENLSNYHMISYLMGLMYMFLQLVDRYCSCPAELKVTGLELPTLMPTKTSPRPPCTWTTLHNASLCDLVIPPLALFLTYPSAHLTQLSGPSPSQPSQPLSQRMQRKEPSVFTQNLFPAHGLSGDSVE